MFQSFVNIECISSNPLYYLYSLKIQRLFRECVQDKIQHIIITDIWIAIDIHLL